ncbi:MAG: PLD nuclease N-terminal domain-containing protein [Micrococcales bacterium]
MRFFLMTIAAWVIFTVFVAVFAISHDGRKMRLLPKLAWLALILVMPFVGGILYLTVGRPAVKPEPPTRSVAPDDNPEFLADLEERLRNQTDDKDDK